MKLINFSHSITPAHLEQLRQLYNLDIAPADVIEKRAQFDLSQPLGAQAATLLDEVGIAIGEWENESPLFALPAHADIAAAVLAEIEGRSGNLPAIVRRAPVPDAAVPTFTIVEVLNLLSLRNAARARR